MEALIVEYMTWPEIAEVLSEVKVAVFPVGSCEQHGPNSTFVTDTVRADLISKLLAQRCGHKILVFPPVTYGISSHHMDFPTSITLRVDTLTSILIDLALSAAYYEIEKVLFVNAHGGNKPSLMSAVQKLKQEHNIVAFWTPVGSEILENGIEKYFPGIQPGNFGHACEMETSQTMYLRADIVREKREKGVNQESIFTDRTAFIPGGGQGIWNWKYDVTFNGALGDARKATAEIGEAMTDEVLNYLERLVQKIIDYKPHAEKRFC
jgi:creatinine amidohydrolase